MAEQKGSTTPVELLGAEPAQGRFAQFCEGAVAPWRGFQYLQSRPALWRYAVVPVLFNVFITLIVLSVLIAGVVWFINTVHPWFTGGQTGWSWWLWLGAEIALALLLLLVCGGAAILVWKFLSGVLCGYFYGRLAEQVERQLGLPPEEINEITLWHEVVDTSIGLSLLVTVNGLFLGLNLIPLVGGAVAMIGSSYFTWLIMGTDYLTFPLSIRGVRRWDQIMFARRHQPQTLGLGATVFLLEFIPIAGALFLTTAVVGAVLLHRRLQAADRIAAEAANLSDTQAANRNDSTADSRT